MKRILAIALAIGLLASTGQTSNQALSHQDVIDNVAAGNLIWISGQPGGWSGSNQLTTRAEFVANVQNSGSCAGTSAQVLAYADMVACRVLTSVHTPILANYTFAAGSFSSWNTDTTTYSGCSSGETIFAGVNAAGQDGTGYASGASGTACNSYDGSTATIGLNQTFTISGTPTSQSYSFYYRWNPITITQTGHGSCTGTGSATGLKVYINGSLQSTISPTGSGSWVQVTGSTSGLVNGSNTIDVVVTLSAAAYASWKPATSDCTGPIVASSQPFDVDNFAIQATY